MVYKARDHRLDRLVAIKVLSENTSKSPEQQARLIQEAKTASALNHPNIVTIYEIDVAGGHAFIAMEYIEGPYPRAANSRKRPASRRRPSIRDPGRRSFVRSTRNWDRPPGR